MMRSKNKQILVVGDRVLIKPDKGEQKSKAGLYLPPSVIEKQEILSGVIVEIGPGIPLGNPEENIDEPWSGNDSSNVKYIPTQADVGDIALFLNKASIEIKDLSQKQVERYAKWFKFLVFYPINSRLAWEQMVDNTFMRHFIFTVLN